MHPDPGTGTKAVLRDTVRQRLARMPREEREVASRRIAERIEAMEEWRRASHVGAYCPRPPEPDVELLWARALRAGKRWHVPRYDEERGVYEWAMVASLEGDWRTGRYGIREALPGCAAVKAEELDFILVPGMAFSVNGCRLGRGGGYFDRLLSRGQAFRCGVAYASQIFPELPTESHDVRMHAVVTQDRCLMVVP